MSQQQCLDESDVQHRQSELLYEYDTLPNGQFSRYFVLQPANSKDGALFCTLYTAHLEDFPRFEAVSYVWGERVKNRSVSCNGKNIRITNNLFEALLQVRLTDKPRTLWADSICINQANVEEQAQQVSFMKCIYRQTVCTLICLGSSSYDHAQLAANLVAEVDNMIQSVFDQEKFDWAPNSFPFPDEGDPLISHKGWQSFGVLLQQPWFRRGWVIQEATLGQRATLIWAATEIDWTKLMRVYIWRMRRALKLPNDQFWMSDLFLQGFHMQRRKESTTFHFEGAIEPYTPLEILGRARWHGFSDPRDRIYAFLDLGSPFLSLSKIWPSYTASYLQVYRDFACKYLGSAEDLDILHFVQHDDITISSDFPTWVPRWNLNLYGNQNNNLNNYSRFSKPIGSQSSSSKILLSSDQAILELCGMLIDTISFAGPSFDKTSTTVNDVASLYRSVLERSTLLNYSCGNLRAFVSIFRCGVYRGRLKEWQALESAYMQRLENNPSQDGFLEESVKSFQEMRIQDVHNKKFVITHRGYYGLAPNIVQEGDLCCVIIGTRSPFILRKTNKFGHYRLVGSILILSKHLDLNGYPETLGKDENSYDWEDWGPREENIFIL